MNKIICDVCGKNEASREFIVKRREKRFFIWEDWEEIDICGECAEKLFNMKYLDKGGFGRPPAPKA